MASKASLVSSIVTFIASPVVEVNTFLSIGGEATFTLEILENKSDPVLILREIRPSGLGEEDTDSILIGGLIDALLEEEKRTFLDFTGFWRFKGLPAFILCMLEYHWNGTCLNLVADGSPTVGGGMRVDGEFETLLVIDIHTSPSFSCWQSSWYLERLNSGTVDDQPWSTTKNGCSTLASIVTCILNLPKLKVINTELFRGFNSSFITMVRSILT